MSEQSRRNRIGTRQLLIIIVVTVLAAAGSLTALRIAPPRPLEQAAATPETTTSPQRSTPSTPQRTSSTPTTPPSKPPNPVSPDSRRGDRAHKIADWLDIPDRAMRSYVTTANTLQQEQSECELSWVTLAALGKIASDHGRYGERRLDEQGLPSEPIGTIEVRDFDGADISAPAATGPLQLRKQVWQQWAGSATGDEPNIQNIDDATLTAGKALCAQDRDLSSGDDWVAGLSLLNDADRTIDQVMATAYVYGMVGNAENRPDPHALQAVTFAINKIGLPYVWGGDGNAAGDEGFDCSGLTKAAYGVADIGIPRTAHAQYTATDAVGGDADPALGDLIFYGSTEHIHHVGIYIGYGRMVDAPTFGQAVQVHPYRTAGDDFVRAGRPASH